MRRSKIISTLGPASNSESVIKELYWLVLMYSDLI